MNLSRRDRREWRIILWISLSSVLISAYFGYAITPPDAIPLGRRAVGDRQFGC